METTTTTITDDLGGTGKAERVFFSYKGTDYQIDLNEEHQHDFDLEMDEYLKAAREVTRKRPARRPDAQNIRAWAADNGHTVSERGRIPQVVITAYEAAQRAE
jgi:hypothetical protein